MSVGWKVWDGKRGAVGLRARLCVPGAVRAAGHCLSSAAAQLALVRHEIRLRRGRSASRSSYRLSSEQKEIVTEKAWVYP